MNEEHLKLCSSPEWAEAVQNWIVPWVLAGVDLGDDVLEVGPGPGLTTDVLRTLVPRLTAVEVDPELAAALAGRLIGSNVEVLCADASRTQLPGETFSGAVCLTMLHHVPSAEQQDAVLAEIHRVLRPGGVLAGQDSLDSPDLRELHRGDTYLPIAPDRFAARLSAIGFVRIEVTVNEYAVRFRAFRARGDQVTTPQRVRIGALTIMAARPRMLAHFYSRLLDWPYVREETPAPDDPPEAGYALVCPPDGVIQPALNFDYQRDHRRTRWPTVAGEQTPTMHLDVTVDDLDIGVAWAIECGATVSDLQPRPDQHRVVIDPEGNPICLCLP